MSSALVTATRRVGLVPSAYAVGGRLAVDRRPVAQDLDGDGAVEERGREVDDLPGEVQRHVAARRLA